jgi:excisionase family DNA binding protein
MISTEQAAELVGVNRRTVAMWIERGRAIGLSQAKRGYRMPGWQFDPPLWDVLPKLSAALGTTEGWALLAFLETPLGGLDGNTPRQAIEQGEAERVLLLAQHNGES